MTLSTGLIRPMNAHACHAHGTLDYTPPSRSGFVRCALLLAVVFGPGLIVVLVPGCCWPYFAFSVLHSDFSQHYLRFQIRLLNVGKTPR